MPNELFPYQSSDVNQHPTQTFMIGSETGIASIDRISVNHHPSRPTLPHFEEEFKNGGQGKNNCGTSPRLTSFGIISSETAIQRVHVKFEQLNVKYDSNNRWELRYLNRDLI